MKNKVIICNPHKEYRQMLRKAINLYASKTMVVGDYTTMDEITNINKVNCLIAMLDKSIRCPFQFVKKLRLKNPELRIIIMTFWDYRNFNLRLIGSGADGYYITGNRIEKLIELIESDRTTLKKINEDKLTLPQKLKGVG